GRGRHTTRLARLVEVDRGMVADTPGFSRLDLTGVRPGEVGKLFPEVESRTGDCRFPDCLHRAEPECAVRDAVAQGLIAQWRYDTYLKLLAESEDQRPW
ncbi:MAG TPA: ribosome small subunit-dependent GTPase A, partial [Firmicutes bacterium]|nr:ribosome small subunit-dependent GTPase A [Bacillota bacterium]